MQINTQNYHVFVLKREFEDRQKRDPKFSLRAYARFLEVDPSALSAIFKGKRNLPKKNAEEVADKLNLEEKERILFRESIFYKKSGSTSSSVSGNAPAANEDSVVHVDVEKIYHELKDTYRNAAIWAEWEHMAILYLMEVKDFVNDELWISERLGITYERVREVVRNLVETNIITIDTRNNTWHRNLDYMASTDGVPSKALKACHEDRLRLASTKIHSVPVDERVFSATTFAMDRRKVPMAAKLMKEFRRKLGALMSTGETTDVYIMQMQLYPVTEANTVDDFTKTGDQKTMVQAN